GVELKSAKVKREIYDAFFDDLDGVAGSIDNFKRYRKEGVEFVNLSRVLNEIGGRNEKIAVFRGDAPEIGELTKIEVEEKFFTEIDLINIPKQLRTRIDRYSSDWTKEQFIQTFRNANGKVEQLSNPERITKIVNVDKLIEKTKGLRNFKKQLKKEIQELGTEDSALAETKRIVIGLYRRYLNVLIAQEYSLGRVLAAQSKKTEKEEVALGLVKGTDRIAKADRFSSGQASRTIERIDHFLQGTGVKVGDNGLFMTIPERLSEYAQARADELSLEDTEEYKKYNSYKVNAQQAKVLCEAILQRYGLAKGDKIWEAVVLERKGTLGVNRKKREIRIPKSFRRGLVDTVAVLAHEVEGHVLRYKNREESFGDGLRLIDEFSTGRSSVLSEAAAMRIEDNTKQAVAGVRKEALSYYYLVLLEKRNGGSFKECFHVFFEAYAKKKYDLSLEEALKDERYREIFDHVYPRTLRIFRMNTPLNDRTGFLPDSKQMQYIEQELVVDVLKEKGLSKLLHVAGIDLYSIQELRRIGMLDLSKVKEPKMIMAKEIWPQVKKFLDAGRSLDEAIVNII
ncbi:MAG: hypothetical protein Q7I98_06970, partial [Erysipelotrichaceae bacterium]|nr:hypothetical protein [Erysipelotrichaceae bacterium]